MAFRCPVKDFKASWRGAGRPGVEGGAEGWCSPPPSQGWMARGASRRGGEAGSFVAAWEEACVSASCSGTALAAEVFEARTSPADSKGVEALGGVLDEVGKGDLSCWWFNCNSPFSFADQPVLGALIRFVVRYNPRGFLFALLGGIFFRSGAGRAAALDGPTGGDWPWAALGSGIS